MRITQHALYGHEQGRGFGADGLRHVLQLYQAAGAAAVLVDSASAKGTACFKKCGMVCQGGNEFRILLNQQSAAEEESKEESPELLESSSSDDEEGSEDDEEGSEDDILTPNESGFAARNAPRDEEFITPGTKNVKLTDQLKKLIEHTGRSAQANRSVDAAKRSVLRGGVQPGLAKCMGNLFQEAIRQANKAYKLTDLFPLQLSHVLMHMDEGRPFLEATETKKEKEALADAAVAVVDKAGRTCRSSIVGVLGSSVQGHLNTRRVAEITNSTVRYVQKAVKQSREGDQGAFVSLQRSGFGQAQKLCPTRLDPALGACKDGTECKYLHACQMCNNGICVRRLSAKVSIR